MLFLLAVNKTYILDKLKLQGSKPNLKKIVLLNVHFCKYFKYLFVNNVQEDEKLFAQLM